MRECGMPEEQIAAQLAAIEQGPALELWACNAETFQLFVDCFADWAVEIMPSGTHWWRGIPSPAIESALHLAGVTPDRWPEVSKDLRHMARAAAEQLNERKH